MAADPLAFLKATLLLMTFLPALNVQHPASSSPASKHSHNGINTLRSSHHLQYG